MASGVSLAGVDRAELKMRRQGLQVNRHGALKLRVHFRDINVSSTAFLCFPWSHVRISVADDLPVAKTGGVKAKLSRRSCAARSG